VNGVWQPPASSTPAPPPPSSTLPVPGTPTTSTITLISGPTTIQNGQQLWKFQSVEGPNWDTARWGTNTQRFNVTVVPGSGPLPVTVLLHGAQNGAHEPWEFIDTLTPGIYVSPTEISYSNGLIDPVTGTARNPSWWMGYKDANGVFQPITADRVVRYTQWVLTQTSRWTPDVNRVYIQGGSMGGGGAQKIALLNPSVFAAAVSGTGWIDLTSWVEGTDCTAGMRWRTADGPLCRDMHDTVYLVRNPQGRKVPMFMTWNSNDGMVSGVRYPELMTALEQSGQGYRAEWQVNLDNPHQLFWLPGEPHLQYRLNVTPTIVPATGSSPTAASGARTNLGGGGSF
jgi:prolyl oligopeptidase family protein